MAPRGSLACEDSFPAESPSPIHYGSSQSPDVPALSADQVPHEIPLAPETPQTCTSVYSVGQKVEVRETSGNGGRRWLPATVVNLNPLMMDAGGTHRQWPRVRFPQAAAQTERQAQTVDGGRALLRSTSASKRHEEQRSDAIDVGASNRQEDHRGSGIDVDSLAVGSRFAVWSTSTKQWYEDGVVLAIEAKKLKVQYNEELMTKSILLSDLPGRVRRCAAPSQERASENPRSRSRGQEGTCQVAGIVVSDPYLDATSDPYDVPDPATDAATEEQMISVVPEVRSRDVTSTDHFLLLGCDGVSETRASSQAPWAVSPGGVATGMAEQRSRKEAEVEAAAASRRAAAAAAVEAVAWRLPRQPPQRGQQQQQRRPQRSRSRGQQGTTPVARIVISEPYMDATSDPYDAVSVPVRKRRRIGKSTKGKEVKKPNWVAPEASSQHGTVHERLERFLGSGADNPTAHVRDQEAQMLLKPVSADRAEVEKAASEHFPKRAPISPLPMASQELRQAERPQSLTTDHPAPAPARIRIWTAPPSKAAPPAAPPARELAQVPVGHALGPEALRRPEVPPAQAGASISTVVVGGIPQPTTPPKLLENLKAAGAKMQSLPPGWDTAFSVNKQRTYFFNRTTNETQWEHPGKAPEALVPARHAFEPERLPRPEAPAARAPARPAPEARGVSCAPNRGWGYWRGSWGARQQVSGLMTAGWIQEVCGSSDDEPPPPRAPSLATPPPMRILTSGSASNSALSPLKLEQVAPTFLQPLPVREETPVARWFRDDAPRVEATRVDCVLGGFGLNAAGSSQAWPDAKVFPDVWHLECSSQCTDARTNDTVDFRRDVEFACPIFGCRIKCSVEEAPPTDGERRHEDTQWRIRVSYRSGDVMNRTYPLHPTFRGFDSGRQAICPMCRRPLNYALRSPAVQDARQLPLPPPPFPPPSSPPPTLRTASPTRRRLGKNGFRHRKSVQRHLPRGRAGRHAATGREDHSSGRWTGSGGAAFGDSVEKGGRLLDAFVARQGIPGAADVTADSRGIPGDVWQLDRLAREHSLKQNTVEVLRKLPYDKRLHILNLFERLDREGKIKNKDNWLRTAARKEMEGLLPSEEAKGTSCKAGAGPKQGVFAGAPCSGAHRHSPPRWAEQERQAPLPPALRAEPISKGGGKCGADAGYTVFVGGLTQAVGSDSLRLLFGMYGVVVEADVKMDRETGNSRGFAYVTFSKPAMVERCLANLKRSSEGIRQISIDGKLAEVQRYEAKGSLDQPSPTAARRGDGTLDRRDHQRSKERGRKGGGKARQGGRGRDSGGRGRGNSSARRPQQASGGKSSGKRRGPASA